MQLFLPSSALNLHMAKFSYLGTTNYQTVDFYRWLGRTTQVNKNLQTV